jgi:hypothetical protein
MFLAFPVARFKKISQSSIQIVLAVAGLFALIHWPNGILMLACLLAMIVWARVYLRQAKNFHIFLNGAPLFIGPPNSRRNDINQHYRLHPATMAVFVLKLPIQRATEIKDLRIFAIPADGIPREIIYPPGYSWITPYQNP